MIRYGLILLLFLLAACEQNQQKTLPEALASPGDLVVICDPLIWKGEAGDAIKKTFGAEQPGLPQSEPWFNLIHFDEGKFNGISRRYRSILLVTTLDNDSKTSRFIKKLLGEKAYSQELTDSSLLFIQSTDRWAKGQQVIYLIGQDAAALTKAIQKRQTALRQLLLDSEIERMKSFIQNRPRNPQLEKELTEKTGLRLPLPQSYQARILREDFVWLVREQDDKQLNLFISQRPYHAAEQFTANAVLAFKDSVTKVNIPGPTPNSWYTTEYLAPVDTQSIQFAGGYALKMRGLWKVENDFMGGPFVNMTVYDSKGGRLIHLEGFVYYPKEKKRELLRELEGLLASLQF